MVRLLIIFLCLLPVLAAAAEPVALVEIRLDTPADQARFEGVMGELDILELKPGAAARVAVRTRELAILQAAGLTPRVLEEDLEARVVYPAKGPGYGVYHTRSESIAFVDSLRLLYPEVISAKWSIGLSGEGRDIWAFRVSDNPDLDENEHEILIDGAHHAREIMASEFTIMFAEYLAQNYGTDPEITWLLDNRELYIVPIVNPDGFVYNEVIEPDGGGMWRKTRRDNGDGTFGVDPNRNYPYQWGYDDLGSSPDPASDLYRGPFAGSEPEVQAMMAFINSRAFSTQNTVHTYSNLTLYPFGYAAVATPDEPAFAAIAAEMVRYNGYDPKPVYGLYEVNGGTADWAYGAQTEHAKIFCFSNEIGGSSDGFWPAESRRGALFEENIWPNLVLMRAAGPFVTAHTPVTKPNPAKAIDPGQTGDLTFTVQNQSPVYSSAPVQIFLASDDPWLYLDQDERTVGVLAPLASVDLASVPVPFSVDPDCPDGHVATVRATVDMLEGPLTFPLAFMVGSAQGLLADDLEAGTGNWLLDGTWALTTAQSHSPGNCLTDSPGGDYADDQATAATLADSYFATAVSFWHRYDIEDGWDYGRLQVRTAGDAWTTVASFTGTEGAWVQETVLLEDYLGQELEIRFLLETDTYITADGWYLDDVTIYGVPGGNLAPDVPTNLPPAPNGLAWDLAAAVGPDPEGSPVVGGFRLYRYLTGAWVLMAESDDIPAVGGQVAWTTPPLPDGDYKWRAWAGDGAVRSDLSPEYGMIISGVSGVGETILAGPSLRVLDAAAGRVRLQVGQDTGGEAEVEVFDLRGARVRRLHSGWLDGGSRVLVWDGKDRSGRGVASGVYLVRARIAGRTLTDRVVLVR